MAIRQDLTGQKFGRLTVVKPVQDKIEENGRHRPQWLCACECGNSHIVTTQHLKNGNTKSCGCLNKELTAQRNSDRFISNTYNLDGEYGIGYTGKGQEFYFDLEDYDKIVKHQWYISNSGYVTTKINRATVLMHRMLLNPNQELVGDHINHNKIDNRKSNLRAVSQQENMHNKSISKLNKSGYAGVRHDKKADKWTVTIGYKGKAKYIGCFKTIEEAINARKEAELKYGYLTTTP